MSSDHDPEMPRSSRQQLCDAVKEHAGKIELGGIYFLNAGGRKARHYDAVKTIQIQFIDGRVFNLTKRDFKELENFNFKLRPKIDDA